MGWLKPAMAVLPGAEQGVMILRRGFSPAFYFFCQVFAKEHDLEVLTDRRMSNGRRRLDNSTTADRRYADRRADSQWPKQQDFSVVRNRERAPQPPTA